MGIPARTLCRVAEGRASGGLSRRETVRAFQESSQALLHDRGPFRLAPPKVPRNGQRSGGQTQVRSRDMQGIEPAGPDRGQRLWSSSAMLLSGGLVGTNSFALCTNLHSRPETMSVRSKKH